MNAWLDGSKEWGSHLNLSFLFYCGHSIEKDEPEFHLRTSESDDLLYNLMKLTSNLFKKNFIEG